ncbi:MAG: hypothetical protein GX087_07295 [Desulfobulbaceae bacterium]|nr:hypothetical protein [Desulfobulbaceae bacterium]
MALATLLFAATAQAQIPATQVMTLYRFNGPVNIPYYDVADFRLQGAATPAGTLAQGSSVVPCLVIQDGEPLTDNRGVPYVGFSVIVDARTATPASSARFLAARKERKGLLVQNNHCSAGVRYVLDVRNLYDMSKPPFFEPPPVAAPAQKVAASRSTADNIVRAFHNSSYCALAARQLTNRRSALQSAWDRFKQENRQHWSLEQLERARHLDYTMRTAIFEGHLERGCNAYGTCERNIVALSIRNRARESCHQRHGCATLGDFTGVSSAVSQYNIWDEYLTQISGLTSCFLRDDLSGADSAGARTRQRYQQLYAQNVVDTERILYGDDHDLQAIFPHNTLAELKGLKHYYHAPAMGKCFPQYERVEYMSGAVARRGLDFALIADTRIQVGDKVGNSYRFRSFRVQSDPHRDEVRVVDNYPGFVVDSRRVTLQPSTRCAPYGLPAGCNFSTVGRYRKTPSWVNEGRPLEVRCRVTARGETCQNQPTRQTTRVGGVCDTEMQPFTGVR